MYTFYCNRSSVQFSPILSKSGLDQKSYSANKKGVKFFETQCICIYVHLYASIEMVFTVEMQSALTITISILEFLTSTFEIFDGQKYCFVYVYHLMWFFHLTI